jgi:hypothetical protein
LPADIRNNGGGSEDQLYLLGPKLVITAAENSLLIAVPSAQSAR